MPIYEYICRKGHEFEEMQSFSAEPVARCPHCGTKAQRKISLAAFHLKGSGWYLTDSRSSSSAAAATEPTSGGDPADKSKESKPAGSEKADASSPATTAAAEPAAPKSKTAARRTAPSSASASRSRNATSGIKGGAARVGKPKAKKGRA